VRKGKGHALRITATTLEDLGEWDRIKVPFFDVDLFASQILWHVDDVFVQEPSTLRQLVVHHLEALVKSHG